LHESRDDGALAIVESTEATDGVPLVGREQGEDEFKLGIGGTPRRDVDDPAKTKRRGRGVERDARGGVGHDVAASRSRARVDVKIGRGGYWTVTLGSFFGEGITRTRRGGGCG
tara:strand:- start:882 stop:1220 length:339 start_codon:yes stop_codon:yes gene_type:complete